MKAYDLQLLESDVQVIAAALAELPYRVAVGVLSRLGEQLRAQGMDIEGVALLPAAAESEAGEAVPSKTA